MYDFCSMSGGYDRHIEPIQGEAVTHPVGRSSGGSCPRLTPATALTEGSANWVRRQ